MEVGVRTVALATLVLSLIACRGPSLSGADGEVSFARAAQHLGDAWVGVEVSARVVVQNHGRSELPVSWEVPEGFTVDLLPLSLPSGDTELTVRFAHREPGLYKGILRVKAERSPASSIVLSALSLELPACNAPGPCSTWTFDLALGECVETVAPDGMSCDAGSHCVLDATCQQGRCVGTARTCDDGNACTLNTCNALTGCEFPPAPPCPGDGKCGLGVCHPSTGCSTVPAQDGTVCGQVACDAAEVCIGGACVIRDPPDGFICAEASPCQGQGICAGTACVRPAAVPLTPEWSYNVASPTEPAPQKLHDFMLDDDGRMAMTGFFSSPVINAGTSQLQRLDSKRARRCLLWNTKLACADLREYDLPGHDVDGTVALLDAQGGTLWRFRLATARPAFVQQTDNLFLARLVVMGPDRLAAIYEAFPKNSAAGTQCRAFYLAVLDAAGGLVSAQKISDAFLGQCNHPHPYGAVSDVKGNLYLSFSPSSAGTVPLIAQNPSLLHSYDRDGAFRWRRVDVQPGGELGVVGNLLFSEGSQTPLFTSTGAPLTPLGGAREMVGRAVATSSRYVSSPWFGFSGATELHGYAHDTQRAWSYELSAAGDTFLSRELRLGQWHPRPQAQKREVVLAFARLAGQGTLLALDPQEGRELWRCELHAHVASAPQLFEVARDQLVVMGDAEFPGEGDPPFANSHGSFWRFRLNGVGPSGAPWPGTWGGAGHDHHEKGSGVLGAPSH
jgi:hypothetical protein